MKTYYLYAKLSRNGLHFRFTLSNKAPADYFPVCMIDGRTKENAWHNWLRRINVQVPNDYLVKKGLLQYTDGQTLV